MANKPQTTTKRGDVVIYLRMDKVLADEMKAIARSQNRTIAGQIAFALSQWLCAQNQLVTAEEQVLLAKGAVRGQGPQGGRS